MKKPAKKSGRAFRFQLVDSTHESQVFQLAKKKTRPGGGFFFAVACPKGSGLVGQRVADAPDGARMGCPPSPQLFKALGVLGPWIGEAGQNLMAGNSFRAIA